MSKLQFTKAFTQQEAIPEQAKQRVMELLDSGRLHRYNTVGNELAQSNPRHIGETNEGRLHAVLLDEVGNFC